MENKRKAFDVLIEDKLYTVYDIKDKEHEGFNDVPKTWWIEYDNVLMPYHVGCKRICWDISFNQKNTTKMKWNNITFRNNITCTITANGKLFYEFGTFDMNFAMSKAQYLITVMCEHGYNFFEPEKENGRKIFYYGMPATIKVSDRRPWEVDVIPDCSTMTEDEWWSSYVTRQVWLDDNKSDYIAELRRSGQIRTEALSEHIWWFRK